MDLRLIQNATPSDAERLAIDDLLGPPESAWRGAGERRLSLDTHASHGGHAFEQSSSALARALHAIRDATGYISPGGLNYVCQRLDVPPADAFGVASFYALFSLEEQPPVVAHVCDDIACRLNGGLQALPAARGPAWPGRFQRGPDDLASQSLSWALRARPGRVDSAGWN